MNAPRINPNYAGKFGTLNGEDEVWSGVSEDFLNRQAAAQIVEKFLSPLAL